MESIIAQIISAISPSALPIVVCVLGLAYLYWKINSQRKVTKAERDTAQRTIVTHDISLEYISESGNFFTYLPVFNISSNTCTTEVLYTSGSMDGNIIGLSSGTRSVNFSTYTNVTSYNATIKKIVGINRISANS